MVIISKAVAEKRGIAPTITKNGRTVYIDKTQKPVRKPKEKKEVKEKKPKEKVIKKGVVVVRNEGKKDEESEFLETTDSGCIKPKKRIGKKTTTGKKRCSTKKAE